MMLMVPGEIGKDVAAKRMRQHHEGHGPAPELTLVELSNVFLKPLVNQLVGTPFPGGIFRQSREPNSRSTRWFPWNIKLQRTQTAPFTTTW